MNYTAATTVSVCMITYNQAGYIAQAIESVLAQATDFPFELVIGDDNSTDGTKEICLAYATKFSGNVRLLTLDCNIGMLPNLVRTYRACRGEYLALLEGDDFWLSDLKLQVQTEFMNSHMDYSACFTGTVALFEDMTAEPYLIPSHDFQSQDVTIADLLRTNMIATPSVMYRCGNAMDFPDWFFRLTMGDWPLHIMHARHGKVAYIAEPMAVYRRHAKGSFSSRDPIDNYFGAIDFYRAIDCYLDFEYKTLIGECIAHVYREISRGYFRRRDLWRGRRYLVASLMSLPPRLYGRQRKFLFDGLRDLVRLAG